VTGSTVPAVTEFRRKVRQSGSKYRVVKNSLALRAVKDTPLAGLAAKFENTTGVAYTGTDPVALAKTLGYRTIVIDPRSAFGNETRFPHVDQLIQSWPQEAFQQIPITRSTAIAMLTHDPKLDDPALKIALPSPAFYVGALGSKNTQAKRRQRLLDEGLTDEQLNRLHGPIGLKIGAGTPEEIAMSIMAEIVAARNNVDEFVNPRHEKIHT